ncbi:MAG: polysaccharide deacetylase family protein [Clostridia bacterium]|nr:polysaccharide deacetylase family protein [Clostridia bacterium]
MKKYLLLTAALLLILSTVALCMTACDPVVSAPETTDTTADTTIEEPTEEESTMEETTAEETTVAETTAEETTAEETTVEETTVEEETTEPETQYVRDGTPKKYITIRMDDGITQDARMMEIMRKYGVDCCTFYISSGLFGQSIVVYPDRPDVTHKRYTRREIVAGVYDGFDVQSHTVNHYSLKGCGDSQVTSEITRDVAALKQIFGYRPVGVAWPGGDGDITDHTIDVVMETTNIRYGSCTTRNTYKGIKKFGLPQYFMRWYPTCSVSDADAQSLLEEFIAAPCTEDMLYFVWGHGFELDRFDSWDKFELMIKTIAAAAAADEDIVLVTNSEFYELFKEEIPAWKE